MSDLPAVKFLKREEVKVGDVVKLVSGGCPMTIALVHDNGMVTCVWFTPDGIGGWAGPDERMFPLALLTKIQPPAA